MSEKILIVDDEPDIREVLRFRLEKAGYEVVTAMDGKDCLKKVEAEKPDLIILDIMMPGMNGFQVCKLLKEKSDIPVIMLTVLAHEKDLSKGLEKGASCFISKPFNIVDLLVEIQTILKKGENDSGNHN